MHKALVSRGKPFVRQIEIALGVKSLTILSEQLREVDHQKAGLEAIKLHRLDRSSGTIDWICRLDK